MNNMTRELLLAEYLRRSHDERKELASEFSNALCIFGCLGMLALIAFVIGVIVYSKLN